MTSIAELEECMHVVATHARQAYVASQNATRVSDRDRFYAIYEAMLACYQDMAASVGYKPHVAKRLRDAVERRIVAGKSISP